MLFSLGEIEICRFAGDSFVDTVYLDEHTFEILPNDKKSNTFGIIIKTLEGNHLARQGDYIIKGIKGEFYSCKPEIFEATYEKV